MKDGSLAPKIKKLEAEQERNTKVFLNRIVSKVAWAKQLGNEQPTGSHGVTPVKTAVPTGRGTFAAPRTYAQVASHKGKERAGSSAQGPKKVAPPPTLPAVNPPKNADDLLPLKTPPRPKLQKSLEAVVVDLQLGLEKVMRELLVLKEGPSPLPNRRGRKKDQRPWLDRDRYQDQQGRGWRGRGRQQRPRPYPATPPEKNGGKMGRTTQVVTEMRERGAEGT